MTHTPEPWGRCSHDIYAVMNGSNQTIVVKGLSNEDFYRACECVNALAEIKKPAEFVADARKGAEELWTLREKVRQLETDKARLFNFVREYKELRADAKQLITEMEG